MLHLSLKCFIKLIFYVVKCSLYCSPWKYEIHKYMTFYLLCFPNLVGLCHNICLNYFVKLNFFVIISANFTKSVGKKMKFMHTIKNEEKYARFVYLVLNK